jgi:hypothetical protein
MPRAVALLALAAALCGAQNEECSATTQIDGRDFPEWVAVDGERQLLTGGGTRYKYRVAKVYALGLYVAEGAVAGALAPFAGKGAKALRADPAFFAAAKTGAFGKTLLLNFHLRVHGDAIAKALKDALTGRLSDAVLEEFRATVESVLEKGTKAGTKLYFFCGTDALGVAVGATTIDASIPAHGAKICGALMDTYYGSDPVSPQAKAGMAEGFAKLA